MPPLTPQNPHIHPPLVALQGLNIASQATMPTSPSRRSRQSRGAAAGGSAPGEGADGDPALPAFLLRLPVGPEGVCTLEPLPIGLPSAEAPRQVSIGFHID